MRRFETIATVSDDGVLSMPVPSDVPPGPHAVIVEINERPFDPKTNDPSDWHTFIQETAGAWEGDFERPDQGDYEVRDA